MPICSTQDPVETTTKAVDALLTAMDKAQSPGAVVAYRAALTRHGRNVLASAGPSALDAVLERIRASATDKAEAQAREIVILKAWEELTR